MSFLNTNIIGSRSQSRKKWSPPVGFRAFRHTFNSTQFITTDKILVRNASGFSDIRVTGSAVVSALISANVIPETTDREVNIRFGGDFFTEFQFVGELFGPKTFNILNDRVIVAAKGPVDSGDRLVYEVISVITETEIVSIQGDSSDLVEEIF